MRCLIQSNEIFLSFNKVELLSNLQKDRISLTDLINNLEPNDVLFKGIWDLEKMVEIEKHEQTAQKKFYNGNLYLDFSIEFLL